MKNRTGIRRVSKAVSRFTFDYMRRHRHPVNAALHIVGVPAAFYGIWLLLKSLTSPESSRSQGSNLLTGIFCVVFGYLLQYLGHRSQGNEVGEVILIKKVAGRLKVSMSGTALWQLLGGSDPQSKSAGAKSHKDSPASGNGHKNGNGHKVPSLTSHSLVWWRKA